MKKNTGTTGSSSVTTQNLDKITQVTGNLYKSIAVIGKRANQINLKTRDELHAKLNEFASTTDNLEEVFENREQIEISRFYEKLPNPAITATREFLEGDIYFRGNEEEEGGSNPELNA